jgi:hypothetical protein
VLAVPYRPVYAFTLDPSVRRAGFCPVLDDLVANDSIPCAVLEAAAARFSCFPLARHTPRIIVSLTTFPALVANTLYSLMVQTFRPDMIVLYLQAGEFANVTLPAALTRLTRFGLTIRYVADDIRQYCKLVPALRDFPDDVIAVYDDDVFYPSGSLAALVRSYARDPRAVHANRARLVPLTRAGRLASLALMRWRLYTAGERPPEASPLVFAEAVSGVLYPPRALNPIVANASLFMALAPTHDDLWFWAMTVTNGRSAVLVEGCVGAVNITGYPITPRLCDVNIGRQRDKQQNAMVFGAFGMERWLRDERRRRDAWY